MSDLKSAHNWVNSRPKFSHVKKTRSDLTLCQSRLHTASETFVHHNIFGSGSIFCVFASAASILIGKDDDWEKINK